MTVAIAACTTNTVVPTSTSMPTTSPIPVTPTVASTPTPAATPTSAAPAKRPLLMAHYMPWYQTQAVSGVWGWHWTMNHFDPSKKDAKGHEQLASHFYPLTGPYDSSDDAVLEYQVLLMKASGIDGVLVDWYGIEDFWDYGTINVATGKLFQYVKKAGLKFAIVYEDATIKNMIENKHLSESDAITHGQKVMAYLQNTWFKDDAYLKSGDHPVLLSFGNPPYFHSSSDWEKLFSGLKPAPVFITEDDLLKPIAASSYPWPPMGMSSGGELSQSSLDGYLSSFYNRAQSYPYKVASAFPGFYDIYKDAGVNNGYGHLDARNGATFSATLQAAVKSQPDVIQLVTWNDYGEGTMIEPTVEYGYQYLQMVQQVRRATDTAAFPFSADDLTIPLQIYTMRHKNTGDAAVNAQMDKAFTAIIAGKPAEAKTLLAK
jgi:hypothetical protein